MDNMIPIYAAGYVRCSTEMQDDSIRQQKNEIQKWADQSYINIVRWYEDEGKSGTSFLKRPAFFRLVNDIESGANFNYVLVYDESRWGRAKNARENSYWKVHFQRFGVGVKIINSHSRNADDMESYVVEALESAEASEFSKKISMSTIRGQKANATNGYSNGGTAPYAYKRIAVDKSTGKKTRDLLPGQRAHEDEKVLFEIGNPFEVQIVKRIFNLKLQGLGCKKIATVLNEEGVPCPKRGRWKNKDQKWSANTINTLLVNPAYTGTRVFNRHPQSHLSGYTKRAWLNDPSEWIIKKNSHPAIISEDVFNKANSTRKPYKRNNRFFYESPYLLSGILICKRCGYNFQGQTRKLVSKKTGEEYKISYYEDSGYANKGRAVCSSHLIRKDEIEGHILKQISVYINEKSFLDKVVKTIVTKLMNDSELDILLANLTKQIESNKSILKNLLELINNGVNLKEVQDEVYRINKEIEHYQNNYNELKLKKINQNDINKVVLKVKRLMRDFEKTFSKSPLYIQKNLIRQFVKDIIVDPVTGIITCNFRKIPWVDDPISKKDIFGCESVDLRLGKKKVIKKSA